MSELLPSEKYVWVEVIATLESMKDLPMSHAMKELNKTFDIKRKTSPGRPRERSSKPHYNDMPPHRVPFTSYDTVAVSKRYNPDGTDKVKVPAKYGYKVSRRGNWGYWIQIGDPIVREWGRYKACTSASFEKAVTVYGLRILPEHLKAIQDDRPI